MDPGIRELIEVIGSATWKLFALLIVWRVLKPLGHYIGEQTLGRMRDAFVRFWTIQGAAISTLAQQQTIMANRHQTIHAAVVEGNDKVMRLLYPLADHVDEQSMRIDLIANTLSEKCALPECPIVIALRSIEAKGKT